MPTPSVPDSDLLAAVALRNQHPTLLAAAEAAGMSWSAFNNRLRRAAERGLDGSVPKAVPMGQRIKGVSTLYNAAGEMAAQWVKTDRDAVDVVEMVEQLREAFMAFDGKAPVADPPQADNDLATIYPLADLHIGLLAWGEEAGQSWDVKIAEQTIKAAMGRLFAASPASSQAVILGLGDLLHADNYDNQTSKSKHSLDVDGRYPRVLRAAADLVIWTVEQALAKHDKVLVRILPGNHDDQSAIAVSLALAMYYSRNQRVTVDQDPSRFWWFSWGSTLLGATHGDQAKMKDLPLLMATRNPEAWGQSKHRAIYTGHIHTQTAVEVGSVTVESFRTVAAPDAWHSGMGYGAGRSVTSITHCKDRGEICRQRANIL